MAAWPFDDPQRTPDAADAAPETLEDHAANVVRVFRGLAEDASDGEFALWSQTDLINAIVTLDTVLLAQGIRA